jgi:hypothetical protein
MAFDFPAGPVTGDKYPFTAIAGLPQYTWDGEKWSTYGEVPVPADGRVHYDIVQALTEAQQTQGRQNIYAAPVSALGWSGLQTNGGAEVSQEHDAVAFAVSTATSAPYVVDGWRPWVGGSAVLSCVQTNYFASAGYPGGIQMSVTTAAPSLAAGDGIYVGNVIEGTRIARLRWGMPNAQPITIGFSTAHRRPGTYTAVVTNGGAPTRSYPFSYTQNVADAVEFKVVTVPGDTGGPWLADSGLGMQITFCLGSGTTYTAPALNTWYGANYIAGLGQVNGVAATTDIFRITGLMVLPGIEAPSAVRMPFIQRPYDQELLQCQRYFRNVTPEGAGIGNVSNAYFIVRHAGMRSAPQSMVRDNMVVTDIIANNWIQSTPAVLKAGGTSDYGLYRFDNYTGIPQNKTVLVQPASGNLCRFMLNARY